MASKLKLVEEALETDKQKALSAALKQIDQAFGKGSVMRLGEKPVVEIESISTGSLFSSKITRTTRSNSGGNPTTPIMLQNPQFTSGSFVP